MVVPVSITVEHFIINGIKHRWTGLISPFLWKRLHHLQQQHSRVRTRSGMFRFAQSVSNLTKISAFLNKVVKETSSNIHGIPPPRSCWSIFSCQKNKTQVQQTSLWISLTTFVLLNKRITKTKRIGRWFFKIWIKSNHHLRIRLLWQCFCPWKWEGVPSRRRPHSRSKCRAFRGANTNFLWLPTCRNAQVLGFAKILFLPNTGLQRIWRLVCSRCPKQIPTRCFKY